MDKIKELQEKLQGISNQIETLSGKEDLSDAEVTELETLSTEAEGVQAQIVKLEKVQEVKNKLAASTRKSAPAAGTQPQIEVVREPMKNRMGGFNSMGEFLLAIKNQSFGKTDARFKNEMFERNAEDGGILVPDEMMTQVTKKVQGDDSLLLKTRQFVVNGNSLSLPIDEKHPWNGGIIAYWTNEGSAIAKSGNPQLGSASWKLNKLAALVPVTEELLEDAAGLESYINQMAPEAIVAKINAAIISGDGVGKFEGILKSPFRVVVAKEGGQAADTILAENVIKMYSRMIPSSRGRAEWYINAACEEKLRLLKDAANNYIYLAPGSQMNQTPYGLLLGRPVNVMIGAMEQLGDEGDIVFADLSYYYTISKGGVKQSVSSHLLFDQDKQAFKWTLRLDGKCPFKAPITTEKGGYTMSAIVTLEAR